jgi:hypothetical protein
MATISANSPRSQRANASRHRMAPAPEEPAEQAANPSLLLFYVLYIDPYVNASTDAVQ